MSDINCFTLLDFLRLQSVAESYLDNERLNDRNYIKNQLYRGNNPSQETHGQTMFTNADAQWLIDNYEIITQYPNDQSGFSCTLMRKKSTNEYTLSFRSTEYALTSEGGDWSRDGSSGADGEIDSNGFALAQLSSMQQFYTNLKQGKVWSNGNWVTSTNQSVLDFVNTPHSLNVTGYSLGGHLSTAFTLIYANEVTQTYNFNAAGVGGIVDTVGGDDRPPTGMDIAILIYDYDQMMKWDGESTPTWDSAWWNSLKSDTQEQWLEAGKLSAQNFYDSTAPQGIYGKPLRPTRAHDVNAGDNIN